MDKSVFYQEVVDQIRPLDLIGFKGSDPISSFICFLEKKELGAGEFSHVGIVVNSEILPSIPQLVPGRLYVWESTMSMSLGGITDGTPDIEGKGKLGVQIRDLEEVVNAYTRSGNVAWSRIINNPWTEMNQRKNIIAIMERSYRDLGNRSYDGCCLALLGAIFPCFRKVRNGFDAFTIGSFGILTTVGLVDEDDENPAQWLFCSELVATVYQRLGIIDKDKDPRDVVPMDFYGYDKDGISKLTESITYLKPSPISNIGAEVFAGKRKNLPISLEKRT